MPMHIFMLSDEILLAILEILDYKAVLACQATCRRLNTITYSTSLQYKVELAACGMLDGRHGSQTLDIPERLERLKEYNAAWRKLEWTADIQLPHICGNDSVTYGEPSLLFLVHNMDRPTSVFQEVPSKLRGVPEVHHRYPLEYGNYSTFVDISQDLVIYTDRSLTLCQHSLRALSTGEPHPLAWNQGILERSVSELYFDQRINDIFGDYVLALDRGRDTDLYIVQNWKTGFIELEKHANTRVTRTDVCRFLDDKHIIFSVTTITSLNLSDSEPTISFHVVPFRRSKEATSGSVADAVSYVFHFPVFPNRPVVSSNTSEFSCRTSPTSPAYFYSDPHNRIFSVSAILTPKRRRGTPEKYIVDIPSPSFTSYIQRHPTSQLAVVPWEDWGPQGARVTRGDPSVIARSVCGMRGAYVSRHAEGLVLTVLDYHPLRVARALAHRQDGDGTVVLNGAHIETGLWPLSTTTLPCLVAETRLPDSLSEDLGPVFGFQLCEDGIVLMKYDPATVDQDLAVPSITKVLAYTV
ncbi:hypothetical protein BV25DRAFT_1832015 [Artomyces pyxidatus]|uniref:Uncharacterized protein n=1 Tax=Artomyces pyxidatus TaxID=48021 RepID=A0ACB8SKY2_9AGAM|nr:hypothetical protein BV25DRAFT_1832015 [Artomyces pyxidatus]